MPYPSSGNLRTNPQAITETKTLSSQADWEDNQTVNNVVIENGTVALEFQEPTIPRENDIIAHYDATELSLSDGDSVNTWPDKSGNGYDLQATNPPTYNTNTIGGKPVVTFDGSDDYMEVSSLVLSQPFQVFLVFEDRSFDAGIYANAANPGDILLRSNGFADVHALYPGGLNIPRVQNEPILLNNLWNTTNSVIRRNAGEAESTGELNNATFDGVSTGNPDGVTPTMDLAELVIYETSVSADASDIESFLNDKWGVY